MATQKILTRDFIFCFSAQFTLTPVFHMLIPTLPIYLSRLGSTEVEIGVLIGSLSVSSLILRPFVGRGLVRIPEKTFMMAGALIFVLASIAYLRAMPFWPFLAVRVFQGVGLAFFYTAAATFIANISIMFLCLAVVGIINLSYFYFFVKKKEQDGCPKQSAGALLE